MSVIHRQVYRRGPFGGTMNTTLCGRLQVGGDGVNVGGTVTCKLCIGRIKKQLSLGKVKSKRGTGTNTQVEANTPVSEK